MVARSIIVCAARPSSASHYKVVPLYYAVFKMKYFDLQKSKPRTTEEPRIKEGHIKVDMDIDTKFKLKQVNWWS